MSKHKITKEHIDWILANSRFEKHVFWGKELVLSCKLPNGFTVTGKGACVDPRNFDPEIGTEIALKQVEGKIWELEGYLLQQRLWDGGAING